MTGEPRLTRILFFLTLLPLAAAGLLSSCHGPAGPASGRDSGDWQQTRQPVPGVRMRWNPGSMVRTDTDSATILSVDGDVLFSLSADSPVTLRTGMLNLKSARAVFRVQAHRQSPGQSVEVLRGALTAEKAYPSDFPDTETLHAGTMVMINRDIDLMEKETFDTTALSLRMKGILRFSNIPLAALVKKLEDWYGVEIRLDGETSRRFSGNFENAGIRQVLDALSAGGTFSYSIDGYQVTLDLR